MYCENCGNKLPEDTKFCSKCGNKVEEAGPTVVKEEDTAKKEQDIKPGIRGWLVLVAIGVIVSPLLILFGLFTEFLPLFTDGTWELLTNQNSAYYIPGIGALLKFEIIGNLLFLVLALYVLFLFFKKDRRFPKFFIAFLTFSVVFTVLDAIFASSIPGLTELLESEDNTDLGRTSVAAIIWIPYMLKSKLVKATFTK